MTDSPLAVRFVAAPDHWSRNGAAIKGVVIHMAQGGGTVSWLTRPDGNSSHYVVEYDGEIVQMVAEARAAGSIDPTKIRLTNDPAFTYLGESIVYGRTAVVASMGRAAGDDPNRYVIAIETEGFAGKAPTVGQSGYDLRANPVGGPNAKQRASLAALVNDIRRRRGPLPALGHRDFQSYKVCPGKRIPWVDYGGHALKAAYAAPAEDSEDAVNSFNVPEERTLAKVKTGAWLYDNSGLAPSPTNVQLSPGRELVYVGQYMVSPDIRIVAYEPAAGDTNATSRAMFVPAASIEAYRLQLPPVTDCTAAIAAATKPLEVRLANANERIWRAATDLGATPPAAI